jgi:rhodanese-related sulfurtransferase
MKQKWNSTTSFLIVILFLSFACTKNAEKKNGDTGENKTEVLEAQEFKSKLYSAPDAVLVDVRTPEELTSDGMIEGAININFKDPQFKEKINALDKDKTYFVYCLSGIRSADAIEQMKGAGFKNIYTLKDGLRDWKAEGLETVKP